MARELLVISYKPGQHRLSLEFKLQDFWVGAFWKTSYTEWSNTVHFDLWLCLLPCFPLHWKRVKRVADIVSARSQS